MRKLMFLCCLRSLTLPALKTDFAHAPDSELLAQYQKLRSIALDPNRSAVAENVVLKKIW